MYMTEKSVFKHDQFHMFFQVFKIYAATIRFSIFDVVYVWRCLKWRQYLSFYRRQVYSGLNFFNEMFFVAFS